MNTLTLDFETYYDKDYSLSKKGFTTQDYIQDPRFTVLMCGFKWNDDPTFVLDATQAEGYMRQIDWASTELVAHNMMFDGSILFWRFGHVAARYVDTMSMAQALGIPLITGSASLAKVAALMQEAGYPVPSKGNEVVTALGKRAEHFTPAEWDAYRSYCATDVDITRAVYKLMRQYLSDDEMAFQDMILRCYITPRLRIDRDTVAAELVRVQELKRAALDDVCNQLGTTRDNLAGVLRSNDKFAALLRAMGGITQAEADDGAVGTFVIPTKVSATTGKTTWAFGKTDPEFKALSENDDLFVQALCQARLSAKSSIDETRCEAFLKIAAHGFAPMPYKIGGAHTNRLSGKDKFNVQNLPSGRKPGQSDALRRSICALPGQVVVNYDSSGIELRVLTYASQQLDDLAAIQTGDDLYLMMAAKIYNLDYHQMKRDRKSDDAAVAADTNNKRQLGKTVVLACGYGQSAAGFKNYALVTAGIRLTTEEAQHAVNTYRRSHDAVTGFWTKCKFAIEAMLNGFVYEFGGPDGKMFRADGTRVLFGRKVPGILCPGGMWLNYPDIAVDSYDERGHAQINYTVVGYTGRPVRTKIYPGLLTENLIQHTAFAIMKFQGLIINQHLPIVMNTHDEWVATVPVEQAEAAAAYMHSVMCYAPPWAAGLPLGSEGGWAQSYGAVDDDWSKYPDNPNREHRVLPTTP